MRSSSQRTSLICPRCRKLINANEPVCPYCGVSKPGNALTSLLNMRFSSPEETIKTIITVNVILFVISLMLFPGKSGFGFSPFSFLSPGNQSLFLLGSTGSIPIDHYNRWWTLITANFLHGSLMHILFNMLALRQLGPLVANEYGLHRMIIIYLLGGVAGFFISYLAGIRFTIGASASVCALIGSVLYYGKSRGGYYGRAIYSQISGWALGIFFFGLMVPGINNWGHGGGMAAGALLGFLLGYQEKTRQTQLHKRIARLCILLTALSLLWAIFSSLLILSRI